MGDRRSASTDAAASLSVVRFSLTAFIAAIVPAPYLGSDALIVGTALVTVATAASVRRPAELWRYQPFLIGGLAVCSCLWSALPMASLIGGLKLVLLAAVAWFVARVLPLAAVITAVANALTMLLALCIVVVVVRPDIGLVTSAYESGAAKGIFTHRNDLGFVAALALIAGLAARRVRKRRVVAAIDIVLAGVCLVGAQSQSSFAAMAAVGILWTTIRMGRSTRNATRILALAAASIVAIGASSWLLASVSQVTEGLGRDETLTGRTFIWEAVLNESRHHVMLGTGWDAAWHRGLAATYRMWSEAGFAMYHAHNGYLDFLLQIGAVGLVLLVAVLVRTLAGTIANALAIDGRDWLWPVSTTLALVVTNVTESHLTSLGGWFLLVICYFYASLPRPSDVRALK